MDDKRFGRWVLACFSGKGSGGPVDDSAGPSTVCRSGSESRCWNAHRRNLPGYRARIYLPMRKRSRPKPSRPHSNTRKPSRQPRSYTPLSDALSQPLTFTDTELAEGIQQHSLAGLLAAAISRKRRCDGEPLSNLLCALLVWPLLKVKSLHCFCAELCPILAGQVSVLYDFLGREDINWRGLASELARRVYQANDLGPRSQRAFFVDDTSQARAGRKVEGTSCYTEPTKLVFGGRTYLSPAQKSPV